LNYTYLEDESANLIIVPNSLFKSLIVCNYSTSTQHISFTVELEVNHQYISIDEAESLFESALLSMPLILRNPKPKILINTITADGDLKYELVFYTDIGQLIVYEAIKSQIYRKILEYANISGINPQAFKINTEHLSLNVQNSRLSLGRNISQTLKLTSLFADLVDTDIEKLVRTIKIHAFHQNESIINQAENGSSMYILVHGMLNGTIMDLNNDKEIANFIITPGQFFGEMSLFLGEPRSAFVIVQTKNALVYEIAKESLFELFDSNPALLEKIATKVAERRRSNTQTQRNYLAHLSHSGLADSTQYTIKRIKQWLGF
ncbi:MAG: cyclic nucleotide-binding domain-containing protein, partial [Burkholderiales bacterium]|nr:cyclic nucleotide-binding domain-containing protein [Burkholderiales bacterium]